MTSLASPLVEGRALGKVYPMAGEPVRVLRGVDLTLAAGELVFVTGASGSGKSTLLHLLGLLDRPTEGCIVYHGAAGPRALEALSAAEAARLRNAEFGFVFQQYHLLPDFDALENVLMPVRIGRAHVTGERPDARARRLLDQMGLGDRLRHLPTQLSGGERQRVALARALMNGPRLLLCDEPTGNLDAERAREILRLLEGVHADGVTVLVVTHNADLVAGCRCPYRRLLLRGGQVETAEGGLRAEG